jgi:hypothetical protein
VSSPAARAEARAAVAGGAQSLFWFTHTFTKGWWDDFDVSWEMGDAIATTNAELRRHSQIILGRRYGDIVSTPEDPIKVGLRSIGGRFYLIAVKAATGSSTRGNSKLKLDPRPGSEETQIRPSIRVTSSRQMYRPSPLPPTPRLIGASRR